MTNNKKGWVFAFVTALVWSMNAVYYQSISTYVKNINGPVSILLSMISGAFILLVIAGPGRLSLETLKSKNTWIFGSLLILGYMMAFAKYFVGLNVIEGTSLARVGVIISIIYIYLSTGKFYIKSKLGLALIFIGLLIITITLPPEIRYLALFWLILGETTVVLRARVAELHKQNKDATGDVKSELRVTGYILSVTSLMFILILFIAMQLGFSKDIPQIIPTTEEFFALKPFLLAIFIGAIIMATMKYSEMIATKHIGTVNFFIVTAFVPVLTIPTKYIVSIFTIVPAPILNLPDILGTALITIGAIITVITKNKKPKKLAPSAKKDLHIVRDTIRTAKICFNDDITKTAKSLGIAESTLDKIMRTDKPITKTLKERIIDNYSKNIAGLDHLTGANNKTSCDIELQKLSEIDQALILFIDLNKFKPVNDTYGHKAGDMVLKGIAERLIEQFSGNGFVSRLGGDEFCIIIKGAAQSELNKYITEIKKLVAEEFIIPDTNDEIAVGCSIGGAHYPSEGSNGLKLKQTADKRMYKDKQSNGVER